MNYPELAAVFGTALLIFGMIWKIKSFRKNQTSHQQRVLNTRKHAKRHGTNNWIVAPTLRQCSMAVVDDPSLKYSVPIRRVEDAQGRDYPALIHVMDHQALSDGMSKMLRTASAFGSTVVLIN